MNIASQLAENSALQLNGDIFEVAASVQLKISRNQTAHATVNGLNNVTLNFICDWILWMVYFGMSIFLFS